MLGTTPIPTPDPDIPTPRGDGPTPGKRGVVRWVIACALIIVVGWSLWDYIFWRGLAMTLSEPVLDANGQQISGTFRIDEVPYGYIGNGKGGACLVADIAPLIEPTKAATLGVVKGTCSAHGQCNPLHVPGLPAGQRSAQIWYGYCLPDQNQVKRCWYKPALDPSMPPSEADKMLCNKSLYQTNPVWALATDHEVPFSNGFDVSQLYRVYTNNKPVQWRLVGLLIGKKQGQSSEPIGDPACLSPNGRSC